MSRMKLLIWMAALLAILAGVIVLCSPYAPPVAGPTEIETIWAIEDARQESAEPLVTAMQNNGVPLAYDAAENTFYCTLGLETGESWENIHLTVPDAPQVSVCFVDDYTYDSCADAIAEGYAYELMAYTDTAYHYSYIVFTGLPILSLHTEIEIGQEDTPANLNYHHPESGAFEGYSRVHWRGDGTLVAEKRSMKIELTRRNDGTGKTARNFPGMGITDEVILLSMYYDPMMMRDRLSWDMASLVNDAKTSFSSRKTEYVEVFLNDEYYGVYLIMQPYDLAEEMRNTDSRAAYADNLYRTFFTVSAKDRPYYVTHEGATTGYELMYSSDARNPFSGLECYIDLLQETDDATFAKMAEEHIDIDSALRYVLLLQSMIMQDNTINNMYIWDHHENGKQMYRFAIWDLDQTWDCHRGYSASWFALRPHDRIINQNIRGGGTRQRLRQIWLQMKEQGYTKEQAINYIRQYEHELGASGAYARNASRWAVEYGYPDGTDMITYAEERFNLMDVIVDYIAQSEGTIPFLDDDIRQDAYEVDLSPYLQ